MNLREALLKSKETGQSYMSVDNGGGFISWDDETMYEFTAEQLVADDWESVETGIPKLTNGKWGAVEECSACQEAISEGGTLCRVHLPSDD